MKKGHILSIIAAILILLMLVLSGSQSVLVIRSASDNSVSYFWHLVFGVSFFALNVLAVLGLLMLTRWAFLISYVAVIISTFWFAAPYVPWIVPYFPLRYQVYSVMMINLAFMAYLIFVQIYSRPRQ